jgi:hypothetical protein
MTIERYQTRQDKPEGRLPTRGGDVTVRHMYAATAVSSKGQFQGAVTRGSCQGLRPGQTDSLCI